MLISAVIPTLNEEQHIEKSVRSVSAQDGPLEIIVADGGSTDQTLSLLPQDVRVVHSPSGRALQMNSGAETANGDVLLFLHADTLLPANAFVAIREAIDSGASSGIFRLQFDRSTPLLRLSAFATRFHIQSFCFGDRAIFSSKAAFKHVGGFADVPMFEDLEIVKCLTKLGGFRYLSETVQTSSRRYSGGDWRQQWLNTKLWTRYKFGADPSKLAEHYSYLRD